VNAGEYYYTQLMTDLLGPLVVDNFKNVGSWDLNSGDSQYSFLGSRFMNSFGPDARLVFSPLTWATGARSPITDVLMGLGDDVSFCYGSRITATYGGPNVIINRGPLVKKTGALNPVVSPPSPLKGAYDVLAGDAIKNSYDTTLSVAVTALNLCVTLTTALLDFMVKIKYKESYTDSKGKWTFQNASNDLSTELGKIQISHRYLPRRLLALIYHLETACTWAQLGDALKKGLTTTAKVAAAAIVVVSTMGAALLGLLGGLIVYGLKKSKTVISIVTIILLLLGALAAALVGTLVMV
jgi:hypothetical protein